MNGMSREIEDSDSQDLGATVAEAVIDVWNSIDDFRRLHWSMPNALRLPMRGSEIGAVLFKHLGEIFSDDVLGAAEFAHVAAVHPKGAIADGFHFRDGVRDEENGDALFAQLIYFAHTALVEIDVANGERFVDEKNFRIDVDCDRKCQTNSHAT